jgi:hypothetical protein
MNVFRVSRSARAAWIAVLLCGCGDLTAGGFGEVEVYANADESSTSSSAPSRTSGPQRTDDLWRAAGELGGPAAAVSAAEGLLTAQMRVYLQSDATGQWTEVTEGIRDLTLDLRGHTERRVGIKFVESGRYTRFRVVFSRVQAVVIGGLVVGGVPISGEVNVDLGAQSSLTAEREVLIEVERDGALDVVMDLNASTWLASLSVVTLTVPGAALAEAVAVRVR